MENVSEKRMTGERAMYGSKDVVITDCIFADGESPLKESKNIEVYNSTFQWKYPFWYCENIKVKNCAFLEMGRAGCWYVKNMSVEDTLYEAPKGFRRVDGLELKNVDLPHALETLWSCKNVKIDNVSAKGDYIAMNCENLELSNFRLVGNYSFDGCKNVVVRNSKLLSKDAFWNCENVTVYDSYITGEYLAWNSKNVTFINCTIESLQGLCYVDNLVMKNCKLINTTYAFEYSNVNAEINSRVESVINPKSGVIKAMEIGKLIIEDEKVDRAKTDIQCDKIEAVLDSPDW